MALRTIEMMGVIVTVAVLIWDTIDADWAQFVPVQVHPSVHCVVHSDGSDGQHTNVLIDNICASKRAATAVSHHPQTSRGSS